MEDLAHKSCNNHKSDHIAAEIHLENWVERNHLCGTELASFFDDIDVVHDVEASMSVARWAYTQMDRCG